MNQENSILRCAITLSRRLLVPLLSTWIITADSMLLRFFFRASEPPLKASNFKGQKINSKVVAMVLWCIPWSELRLERERRSLLIPRYVSDPFLFDYGGAFYGTIQFKLSFGLEWNARLRLKSTVLHKYRKSHPTRRLWIISTTLKNYLNKRSAECFRAFGVVLNF